MVNTLGFLIALAAVGALIVLLLLLAGLAAIRGLTRTWMWILGFGAAVALVVGGLGSTAFFKAVEIENLTCHRQRDLRTLDEQSRPLIAAIRAFEHEHGRPPGALEQLVPSYLDAVPDTGLRSWPHWEYRRGYGGWSLDVFLPSCFFDLDGNRMYLYAPDRVAAAHVGERHGDWVYWLDRERLSR